MGLYRRQWKGSNGKTRETKIWWISYMVPGVGQRCESTGTSNKRLARKILDMRRAEIVEGRHANLIRSQVPTSREYFATYLDSRTDLHPNTVTTYESSRRRLESFFGDAPLSTISEGRIEEYKRAMLAKGLRPAGINRNLSLLRLVLKQAKRDRYIAQNPLEGSDLFMDERKERLRARPFTFVEEKRLLSVAKGYLRVLIVLLVDTGLRVGKEALPLRWNDLDLENGIVQVRASKTLSGIRNIPLTNRLKTELLNWKSLTGPSTSEFVFFYPNDPSKHLLKVPKSWARALKQAQVEPRRIYDWRATFATRLNAAGVPQVFVDQLMGHAGGLAQTYAKVDEFKRAAVDKLEALVLTARAESGPSSTSRCINQGTAKVVSIDGKKTASRP